MSTDVPAGDVARYAIETAVWAPSVGDAQPWWFGTCSSDLGADMTVSLHVDGARRPGVVGPEHRETLISCGAALCTLRLAVLRCGRDPLVRVLPDPGRPGLLAEVRLGGPVPVTREVRELSWQIRRRRGHRGPFLAGRVGAPVLSGLREEAAREGALLHVASEGVRVALAAMTEAGEQVRRLDRAYGAEPGRWAPDPRTRHGAGAEPAGPGGTAVRTEPRPPGRPPGWWRASPDGRAGVGMVMVLATEGDERRDWLAAGQALQRVLLRAGAAGLSAAFHTHALEVPELRQFVGARFFDGAHPQIVVRLGSIRGGLGPVPGAALQGPS
jgi:hypothetical protein